MATYKLGAEHERERILKIVEDLNVKWGPFNPVLIELKDAILGVNE